jgi:hypothetical protein
MIARIQKSDTYDTASANKRSESALRGLYGYLRRGDIVIEERDGGGVRSITIETRRDLPYLERTRLLHLAAEAL